MHAHIAITPPSIKTLSFSALVHRLLLGASKLDKHTHTMDPNGSCAGAATDVMSLAAELAHAVNVIMNPTTSQQSRMEAYVACEK